MLYLLPVQKYICPFIVILYKFITIIWALIFQRLLDLNYSPLSALNEADLTSATQTLNLNPTMHHQVKTSRIPFIIMFILFYC
jgi:hypothetical protein